MLSRHCEERRDEAIQSSLPGVARLLRSARNDERAYNHGKLALDRESRDVLSCSRHAKAAKSVMRTGETARKGHSPLFWVRQSSGAAFREMISARNGRPVPVHVSPRSHSTS